MSIEEWWPQLEPDVRNWLIAHNGEPVTPEVAAAIERAGGRSDPDDWADPSDSPSPLELSDEAIDWIEAVANEESAEDR